MRRLKEKAKAKAKKEYDRVAKQVENVVDKATEQANQLILKEGTDEQVQASKAIETKLSALLTSITTESIANSSAEVTAILHNLNAKFEEIHSLAWQIHERYKTGTSRSSAIDECKEWLKQIETNETEFMTQHASLSNVLSNNSVQASSSTPASSSAPSMIFIGPASSINPFEDSEFEVVYPENDTENDTENDAPKTSLKPN